MYYFFFLLFLFDICIAFSGPETLNVPIKVPVPVTVSSLGSQRDIEEKAEAILNQNVMILRSRVHDEYIDFTGILEGSYIWETIARAQRWIDKNLPEDNWKTKTMYMRLFLDTMVDTAILKQQFSACEYRGSDLVEAMAALEIRAFAIHNLNGSYSDENLYFNLTALEGKFEVLKKRAEREIEMSKGMRHMFLEKSDHARWALEYFKAENQNKSGSKRKFKTRICPEI